MKNRKPNISRFYALAAGALLVAGCLALGVGTTLARYRTDAQASVIFEPRVPVSVTLGRMNGETGEFDPTAPIGWEMQNDGSMKMNFVVSNQENQEEPLEVRIRLLGSLHAWSGEPHDPNATTETTKETTEETLPQVLKPEATVTLWDGALDKEEKPILHTAQVMRIPENSALYHSFGEGWVFRFLDENGAELTWILENGQLSCVEMDLSISGQALAGTSLLQLQIVAVQTD